MLFIWQTFVHNVDPFAKVLHTPTVAKLIQESGGDFGNCPDSMEPLLFSIALGAVISLPPDEVLFRTLCRLPYYVSCRCLIANGLPSGAD
jgi:hypothetical protein